MAARLTVYPPDQPVQQFSLDPAREHLIGRGRDCDLRVKDARLSRLHARLTANGDGWTIDDLGSKNGTLLAGRPVTETRLSHGDWISLGGLLGQFAVVDEQQLAAEQQRARTRWDETVDRSRRLDPAAGVDALLSQFLQASLELAGAERGFVMLGDAAGNLVVRARRDRRGDGYGEAEGFAGSRGTLERVLATGAPVVSCDAAADTLLGSRPSVVSGQIRALACLPMFIGEQLTGLVYLDSTAPGKVFAPLDVEILQAFASHAALVLGAAMLRDELADVASLMPRQLSRQPLPGPLLRRLQAALTPASSVATPDGGSW